RDRAAVQRGLARHAPPGVRAARAQGGGAAHRRRAGARRRHGPAGDRRLALGRRAHGRAARGAAGRRGRGARRLPARLPRRRRAVRAVEAEVNVLAALENGLFALGQLLRFPVMALLWVCVAAVLFMAGAAVVEFLARRRERQGFDVEAWLDGGAVLGAEAARRARLPLPVGRLLAAVEEARGEGRLGVGGLEHLVLASEERVRASLTGSRLLVKVGP